MRRFTDSYNLIQQAGRRSVSLAGRRRGHGRGRTGLRREGDPDRAGPGQDPGGGSQRLPDGPGAGCLGQFHPRQRVRCSDGSRKLLLRSVARYPISKRWRTAWLRRIGAPQGYRTVSLRGAGQALPRTGQQQVRPIAVVVFKEGQANTIGGLGELNEAFEQGKLEPAPAVRSRCCTLFSARRRHQGVAGRPCSDAGKIGGLFAAIAVLFAFLQTRPHDDHHHAVDPAEHRCRPDRDVLRRGTLNLLVVAGADDLRRAAGGQLRRRGREHPPAEPGGPLGRREACLQGAPERLRWPSSRPRSPPSWSFLPVALVEGSRPVFPDAAGAFPSGCR